MTTEKRTVAKKPANKQEPKPLPPRIHINEFLMLHADLDDMQKAGFKAVCKKEWMRVTEWKEQLDKYLNK